MVKLKTINPPFNSDFCSKLETEPIRLPCGESVCKLHLQANPKSTSPSGMIFKLRAHFTVDLCPVHE